MKKYLITYDLNKTGQNYEGLIAAIKTYPAIHAMQSVWFIKSAKAARAIYNHLAPFIDKNDFLFVSEVSSNSFGQLKKDVWSFLGM